jgi:hypothetical protein
MTIGAAAEKFSGAVPGQFQQAGFGRVVLECDSALRGDRYRLG